MNRYHVFRLSFLTCASGLIGSALFMTPSLAVQDEKAVEENAETDEVIASTGPVLASPFGDRSALLGAKQFQLTHIFALEIKRIESVCQLSDAQSTKLRIGAKGAVKKMVEEFAKSDAFKQLSMMNGPGADDDAKDQNRDEIKIKEIKDVGDVDDYVWQLIDMGDSPAEMFSSKPPTENPHWTMVVKGTLTDDQYQAFSTWAEDEQQKLSQATMDLGLQQLTAQLVLSSDQQVKLRELVAAKVDKFKNIPKVYASFMFLFATAAVDNDDLKKLLDESQYQRLQIIVSPMKPMLNAMDDTEAQLK